MKKHDLIDDIFARVKEIMGESSDLSIKIGLIDKEKAAIRKNFGGAAHYVYKKDQNDLKCIILSELRSGLTVKQVSVKTGISKTHLYRLLKS